MITKKMSGVGLRYGEAWTLGLENRKESEEVRMQSRFHERVVA